MSIYEKREVPAYSRSLTDPSYSLNAYILEWWSEAHDDLLKEKIREEHWSWYWTISDDILAITPDTIISRWSKKDPICKQYAWYNVLMYFAKSRAETQGFTKSIRKPQWKVCLICNQSFVEDSLPAPLIRRLGFDNLDYCSPCLTESIFGGSNSLTKTQIIEYLRDLSEHIQQVPPQGYGEGLEDLKGYSSQELLTLLSILRRKPTPKRVKELFGSWLRALIEASVLEDGTRKTSRGTQCIAKDNHVCFSIAEKTIDDFLFAHGIKHEKEAAYPDSGYRTDFVVNRVYIEYFGLIGDPDYDLKIKEKKMLCKRNGITLISIYPGDLVNVKKLKKKLEPIL